jgi:hypothetical protein
MTKDNKKSLALKSVSRRKAVKQIVGGVSAIAAYNMLPVRWEKPIIEQIFLPAHAAVSGITLSDPCTAELVSGNQESSIDVIRVSGFVTPPVGGLEVTIEGTPNGGGGGPVTVTTTTGSDGTYSAEVTMVGGPGIVGVGATSTVAGVNGAAHCSVGIPPADHPSAKPPQRFTLSCSGTPACGSQVRPGQSVSATAAVSPNPGAGQQVFIQGFCGTFSVFSSSPDTDVNGEVTAFVVPTSACFPEDGSFKFVFTYAGASCTCEWNLPKAGPRP